MSNLEKYTFPTKNGLLLSTQNFPNGNMLRATSEYLFLNNITSIFDPYWFGVTDCELGIKDFSKNLGVFSRYSDSIVNTTLDDYLVLGTEKETASNILYGARENFGCISVDGKWSFKQFLYRFQGMWQHLRISAGEKPGLLGQFFWAIALYLAANEPFSNQDNWVLSYIMILTKERRNYSTWLTDLAVKYWNNKKGIVKTSSIVSDYLGPDCQDHPLIEAWKKYD